MKLESREVLKLARQKFSIVKGPLILLMSTFTVSTESRGFLIGTVIATGAGLALTITNAVYYGQVRNNCQSISSTAANVMMWLNIILAVIFGIILIWAIYRLVVHPDLRKELGRKTQDYFTSAPQGPITTHTVTPSSTTQADRLPIQPVIRTTSSGLASNVVRPDAELSPGSGSAL
jgi:hypothetical protein